MAMSQEKDVPSPPAIACYKKSFKISKVYIKDLNTSSDVKKQIKRIVDNTVHQVSVAIV